MHAELTPHRTLRRCMATNAAGTIATGVVSAALLSTVQRHAHAPRWVWVCLWAYLLYTRVWATVIPYLRLAYSWNDQGFNTVEGIIGKSAKHCPWENITTVRTSQSWSHRLFNCYRVEIFSSGAHDARFTLEAVSPTEAKAIEQQFMTHRGGTIHRRGPNSVMTPPDGNARSPAPEIIYRMPRSTIFMTGFSYGQFILAIPATAELVAAAREKRPFSTQASALAVSSLSGWHAWLLFITAAIAVGAAISFFQYANFTVSRHPHGLETTRGSIERRRHLHSQAAATGFLVSQSLLMQLFGYYRLDVLSRADQRRELSSCLLPCARLTTVRATIQVLNPQREPSQPGETHWWFPVTRRKVAFAGLPLLLAVAVLAASSFFIDARLCAVVAMGTALISNARFGECAPPSVSNEMFIVRHRLLAPRWYLAQVVAGIETLSSPLSRRWGLTHLRVHAYAGHHVRFRTLLELPETPHALASVRAPHPERMEEEA